MGLLDNIKSRLGGDQGEYDENDQYYDDQETYEADYDDGRHYNDAPYYDDAADESSAASSRKSSVFDNYTPLVSMSDVRSQEIPRHTQNTPIPRAGHQANPQIRTSLPYVSTSLERPTFAQGDSSNYPTGSFAAVEKRDTAIYANEEISDPLFRKHSLSNTGDFSATSPAYYASRSGVGHVRPAGQLRRTHKFREVVVVTPASYAEAEVVANNLRRHNAVVLVLTQTRPELAKRILDFSFGAAAVAEAQVVTISERVYALTASHPLTDAEIELLQTRGVL
ncbi:MAG: cell division protein SepF [Coriobacteriia bacterium]|nr:cell division protein SepF [Coriobacteriia bacterium]MCL2749734.1 cell division protein SepF [Coriobacteriia bacterium]